MELLRACSSPRKPISGVSLRDFCNYTVARGRYNLDRHRSAAGDNVLDVNGDDAERQPDLQVGMLDRPRTGTDPGAGPPLRTRADRMRTGLGRPVGIVMVASGSAPLQLRIGLRTSAACTRKY